MMDSFEFTKIAGAALAALLLVFGTRTIVDVREHSAADHGASKAGYVLPTPAKDAPPANKAAATAPAAGAPAAPAGAPAAPAAGLDVAKVVASIGAAKPDNGAAVFKKCASCHTIDKTGANRVGPGLWGVIGRAKGAYPGFGYSDAMKAKGGNWTYEDLAQFIHNPGNFVKGTKMVFAGIPDAGDVADLIAYLRAQSESPVALPGK